MNPKNDKPGRNKQLRRLGFLLVVFCIFCVACGRRKMDVSPAPITDTGEIVFSEEMMEASVINAGNTYRLAEVMQRASAGEDITIAYLGGSITDGSLANPKESTCYAYLSQQWWEETFPETEFAPHSADFRFMEILKMLP